MQYDDRVINVLRYTYARDENNF